MKHAGAATLDSLEALLGEVCERTELKEKSRGVFYRKSKATLHFHEDPAGLFADLRIDDVSTRFSVNTGEEREALLERLSDVLAEV